MKKTLLLAGVATLFAGVAQAGELELGIEGNASVYGVYANQNGAGDGMSEFGLKREVELNFTGEVALDNGMTVGVAIETDQASTTNDPGRSDAAAYVYAEGGFGKVVAGSEYNAAYLMQVAAPAVDAELDGMDPAYNVISTSASVDNASYAMYGDSTEYSSGGGYNAGAEKLTYISPIWEGLQVGASYTPDTNSAYIEEDIVSTGEMADTKADAAYSVAARYAVEDVLEADWTFGAGFNKTTFDGDSAIEEWNVGVNADVEAWTFGAAYYEQEDDGTETETLALGANYETGAMTYGASYLQKDVDGDDLDRYMAGVNYAYGPGMSLNGSVSYNELEDNDATVVAVGTVINF